MPTSSARFEVVLTPEPLLRQCVLLCGGVAMLTGIALILYMPLALVWKLPLVLAWLFGSGRDLGGRVRGAARLRHIHLDAEGHILGLGPDGRREILNLLTGSIILPRVGWLRVRFPDGACYGELLRGDPARDLEWQRLQLIWRHNRAAFGRQEVS